ncbi:arylsulfatase [Porticoccaceae bacterium]|nr:arylsulfatase [Porticoccaceae bacterium]MDC1453563.1 arylsulfatase [Porticoccaceae bacterium]
MLATPVSSNETLSGTGSDQRPNVVVILVDDAGLTDFTPFGGEAKMPAIQTLAERGIKFSNYHTSPLCAPSRAMLLTGIDNHRTGIATIPEVLTANQAGQPGYSMFLEPGVRTLADRLKAEDYRTYMTGKWHLGSGAQDLPNSHGFDRSFALDASGADNWEQKPYMGYYDFAPWYEDGKLADLPEDFYSSKFIVDRMIRYLESDKQPNRRQPFFSYLAFQAIHIPVQAPREVTDSYNGVYDQGWHQLRKMRHQRAIALGLIAPDTALAEMPANSRDWGNLSPQDRALYARAMQVQAAMLESMDSHIGRFIEYLNGRGELDNTLFIVTSDNGPEPSYPLDISGMKTWMSFNGYNHRLDNLGEKGSMVAIGPEWASASASPLNMFKFYAAEGGIRVPLIIAGPNIERQNWQPAMVMVTDIAPTVLDYLEVKDQYKEAVAITGRSMMPLLEGSATEIYADDEAIGMEVSGNSVLIKGDYKLSRNSPPHGDNIWRLYNLAADPGESQDLRALQPEQFDLMMEDYKKYESEFGVIPLLAGFDYLEQARRNSIKNLMQSNWRGLALSAVVVLTLFWLIIRRVRRRL